MSAAAEKSARYGSAVEADSLEALTKRLADDLRRAIRALGSFPVLSDRWCAMADSLERVGAVSDMESSLPRGKDSTLWEGEELALRFMLEDGKLNVSLRAMADYHRFKRDNRAFFPITDSVAAAAPTTSAAAATSAATAAMPSAIDAAAIDRMRKFERGLGSVLRNAWSHVEALQTTDVAQLLEHCAHVMHYAAAHRDDLTPLGSLSGSQEAYCLHYVGRVAAHVEELDESRVMGFMIDNHVMAGVTSVLAAFRPQLSQADVEAGLHALAMLADTEEFRGHKSEHFDTDDARRSLAAIKPIADAAASDLDSRRKLRPLLDLIRTTGLAK